MTTCPPVLLIVFNRPQLAVQVLDVIRRQKPSRIYLAADGPRDPVSYPSDAPRCLECRRLAETIDWPCEVFTRYSEINQGCGRGVSNAISWFFEHEVSGIILEDDCLPADNFFPYCGELLERYHENLEIMSICGNNFGAPKAAAACAGFSYGFGRYSQVWGWASWARAWKLFQYEVGPAVDDFLHFKTKGVSRLQQRIHQARIRSTVGPGGTDIWGYQWQFVVLKSKGLVICPAVNLISNIGFGGDATHTTKVNSPAASVPVGTLTLPLTHPSFIKDSPALNRIYASCMLGDTRRLRKKIFRSWLRRFTGRTNSRSQLTEPTSACP